MSKAFVRAATGGRSGRTNASALQGSTSATLCPLWVLAEVEARGHPRLGRRPLPTGGDESLTEGAHIGRRDGERCLQAGGPSGGYVAKPQLGAGAVRPRASTRGARPAFRGRSPAPWRGEFPRCSVLWRTLRGLRRPEIRSVAGERGTRMGWPVGREGSPRGRSSLIVNDKCRLTCANTLSRDVHPWSEAKIVGTRWAHEIRAQRDDVAWSQARRGSIQQRRPEPSVHEH